VFHNISKDLIFEEKYVKRKDRRCVRRFNNGCAFEISPTPYWLVK
jgi:hypothetical protein